MRSCLGIRYLVGCNQPGHLFVVNDDGSRNMLDAGVDVFEDGSLYQRLWGATRKWLQGGEGSNSEVGRAKLTTPYLQH